MSEAFAFESEVPTSRASILGMLANLDLHTFVGVPGKVDLCFAVCEYATRLPVGATCVIGRWLTSVVATRVPLDDGASSEQPPRCRERELVYRNVEQCRRKLGRFEPDH